MAHYQFEAIHSFLDGNGRVGRLLIPSMLVERQVMPLPSLYLSAFSEATGQESYSHLLGVSCDGAWEAWLEYFLNGVARQAEDALSRVARINQLLTRWHRDSAGKGTKKAMPLLDVVAENPFITIKGTAKRLGVALTTAQRAIDLLRSAKIVTETSETKRDRVYCAQQVLLIVEEPARLAPG